MDEKLKFIKIRKMRTIYYFGFFLGIFLGIFFGNSPVFAESPLYNVSDVNDPSLKCISIENGTTIEGRLMGPGLPPVGWINNSNFSDRSVISSGALNISNVPSMTWSYGCSPTSATMLFGYYDRNGYPNMYVGPVGGGVFPLTNAVWGSSFELYGQCPLSASQYGLDNRITKGHRDDYYNYYGSNIDPFLGSWSEHTPQDCLSDFMGTSMYQKYSANDGSTWFWYNPNGSPLYDYTGHDVTYRDGTHGMKLFAESRGYTVLTNYNQYILGYNGNANGFTYDQFKAEIDAGYPVLLHLKGLIGHSMLGVGYIGNEMIIHNTWDYNNHLMTWGGSYESMEHYAVSVIHLAPITPTPTPTPLFYTIDVESDGLGWISPSGIFTVPKGSSQNLIFRPTAGAVFKNLTVNDNEVVVNPDNTYTIGDIVEDMVVRLNNQPIPNLVISAFTVNLTPGSLTVQLNDTSYGDVAPNKWKYSFGDGSQSEERNVTHTYPVAGAYTITFWARNNLSLSNEVLGNIIVPYSGTMSHIISFGSV